MGTISGHPETIKAILDDAFGDWWAKPNGAGWDITLDEIWNQDGLKQGEGRILITYGVI
jgi:hypothetical protein